MEASAQLKSIAVPPIGWSGLNLAGYPPEAPFLKQRVNSSGGRSRGEAAVKRSLIQRSHAPSQTESARPTIRQAALAGPKPKREERVCSIDESKDMRGLTNNYGIRCSKFAVFCRDLSSPPTHRRLPRSYRLQLGFRGRVALCHLPIRELQSVKLDCVRETSSLKPQQKGRTPLGA
jgi:hypothetical protein